jgi:hypothetical protein
VLSTTYIELIEFFTLLVWVLNGFISSLLLLSLAIIAWLCYAEAVIKQDEERN